MTRPRMEDHQREGVLRCAGCWLSETASLMPTPSAPGYAEQLVVRALLAWGVPRECRGPAQVAMVDLVRWAVADAQPRASEPSEVAPVVVGVVRHSDGIIIEVTDSLAGSPDHKVLLGLPQPYGLHWLRDGDKRVVGRLVWCGIRHGFDSPPRVAGRNPGMCVADGR